MMICFLKQSEFEVSYVFAWGKEGAVREVTNPFCVCGSPFVESSDLQ